MSRKLSRMAALLCLSVVVLGATPEDPATTRVRDALSRAEKVTALDISRPEKLGMLRSISRELFDTRAMAAHAIGNALDDRSEEERAEFQKLFDVFIVRAYLQKLLFFRDPSFGYAPPQIGDGFTLVRTAVISGSDEYYVNYQMREIDGEWRATEIIVEGIKLIDNYREQFASVIDASSVDELLKMMRRKTKRLTDQDES